MTSKEATRLACGGLLAMAAALGIGRFVYTPILPAMSEGLSWSAATSGLVASANFLGYLLGALAAGLPVFSSSARRWLIVGLAASALSTLATAATSADAAIMAIRFTAGVASAFVIVCASSLVLGRLAGAGRGGLAAVHFSGVGAGILLSAALVSAAAALGADWRGLWIASGLAASGLAIASVLLVPPARADVAPAASPPAGTTSPRRSPLGLVVAYALFGFGYVITATFLVTIVRRSPETRTIEPWIWMLFGLAAVPSVPLWQRLGARIGPLRAYAVAALVEAVGVVLSVDWVTPLGVAAAAVLLGGTFMGLTALGLTIGRALAGDLPQRTIGLMTAGFGAGQMVGPVVAGHLAESTGSLRLPSWLAAAALVIAAVLAGWTASRAAGEPG